jgi:tRNA(Ile)-lysidine synthase TilS/MesJ
MVGLSGGKDSLLLLTALRGLQSRSPVRFDLEACTVDPTEGKVNLVPLAEFCTSLDIPYRIVPVPIFRLIDEREENSPCSFCANMRRGALSSFSRDRNCTTLCLGHHLDDVVETTLMNLFFSGRFHCFSPMTWQDRTEVKVIRPLVYLEESQIARESDRLGFPVVDLRCPFSAESRRTWVKSQIAAMSGSAREMKSNVLHSLRSCADPDNGWHLDL